jgi:hypothetical protein
MTEKKQVIDSTHSTSHKTSGRTKEKALARRAFSSVGTDRYYRSVRSVR